MRDLWEGRANDCTHWPTDRANGGPEWPWGIQAVGRLSAEDPRRPGRCELGETFNCLVGEAVSLVGDGVKRAMEWPAAVPEQRQNGFPRASAGAGAG